MIFSLELIRKQIIMYRLNRKYKLKEHNGEYGQDIR